MAQDPPPPREEAEKGRLLPELGQRAPQREAVEGGKHCLERPRLLLLEGVGVAMAVLQRATETRGRVTTSCSFGPNSISPWPVERVHHAL